MTFTADALEGMTGGHSFHIPAYQGSEFLSGRIFPGRSAAAKPNLFNALFMDIGLKGFNEVEAARQLKASKERALEFVTGLQEHVPASDVGVVN